MANPFLQSPYAPIPGVTLKNVNPNSLINIYGGGGNLFDTSSTTPSMILPQNETLPNGGGTFNPAGKSTITPAPIFTGATSKVAPATSTTKKATLYGPNGQKEVVDVGSARASLLQSQGWKLSATTTNGINYDKYKDPKTGKIMTPEEYAIYLGNKVPKGNGEIPNYAGDAMTNPNQTAAELQTRATNLNNSRNDIATGTTDPYKVGNKSGIAYSPTELAAIEKAYAGIYDPALNDVFARLKTKQEEDAKAAASKASMEERVFATNEAIRQWRATTGTKGSGGGSSFDIFSDTQMNTAARNAGVGVEAIRDMDPDLVNFFYAPPKALDYTKKAVPYPEAMQSWINAVNDGKVSSQELKDLIADTSATPEVKTYYVNMVPDQPGETSNNDNWLQKIWGTVWDITKGLVQ